MRAHRAGSALLLVILAALMGAAFPTPRAAIARASSVSPASLVSLSSPASPSSLSPVSWVEAEHHFVLPVPTPPRILVPFRPPATKYSAGHRGIDLGLAPGDVVVAAGAGVVVYAGRLAGRGVVSIEHASGLRTTYEPVTAVVHRGDRVVAGQTIGSVTDGHPPCAPATCLHWGARLPDGSYLDPMTLISGLRVRLKPWGG